MYSTIVKLNIDFTAKEHQSETLSGYWEENYIGFLCSISDQNKLCTWFSLCTLQRTPNNKTILSSCGFWSA